MGLIAAGLLFHSSRAFAQMIYTDGHGDLGVEYTPGETEFEAHWGIGAGSIVDGDPLPGFEEVEFAPDELVARLFGTASVSNASVASALGVDTGYTAYRTGNTSYPPNLGFALEEVGMPEDWLDESITLTLTGFSGPGEIAISQTISGFGTIVWFSSNGDAFTVNDNQWAFGVGGHQHLDWWFTEKGSYTLEFTWTGTYIGGENPVDVQGSGTFGFQVNMIPEPHILGLLVAGFLVFIVFLRRPSRI